MDEEALCIPAIEILIHGDSCQLFATLEPLDTAAAAAAHHLLNVDLLSRTGLPCTGVCCKSVTGAADDGSTGLAGAKRKGEILKADTGREAQGGKVSPCP
jgi:hypothetical protein